MKHLKTIFACLLMAVLSIGQVWATDVTYTFTSKSWADASSAWTGGGDGNGFTNGQGIQVTIGTTGANATSKSSFSNVSKVVVTYNTNKSNGAGSIAIKIGTNDEVSNSVVYPGSADGTSANFTTQFDFSPVQTGAIKITTNTTTNSIWVKSITITYSDGGTPDPTVSADPEEVEDVPVAGVTNQTIDLTYENITDYETEVTVHPNADGTGTLSPAWLTASVSDADDYATVTYSVSANEGAARTAYIKVYTTDGDKEATTIIPVSQLKYSAPTGTFELFSGDLTEGDYVICSGTTALKNALATNTNYIGYETVTVNNDEIDNPSENLVWHIAQSGGYWTIHNAAANNYAASTGAKNKGQVIADGTDDKALWTASGTSSYEFVNKANTAASVNSNLRYNSGFGFACYSTSTGSALTLYKKQVAGQPATPTFSVAGGNYEGAQSVEISCETVGATIHFTLDGTKPTSSSPTYSTALNISSTTTVKAVAIKDDVESTVATATYTIVVWQTVDEIWSSITSEGPTNANVWGYVSQANVGGYNNNYYISVDGSRTANQLEIYKGDNAGNTVAVGDKVHVNGDLTIFNEIKEFKQNTGVIVHYAAKGALQSVAVDGTPTKTEYAANETFDPAGLKVYGTYANGFVGEIAEGITWGNDLTDGKVIESTTVHVTATVSEITSPAYDVPVTVAAKTLVSIAVGTDAYTIYTGEALPQPVVTATFSEGEPEDVSAFAVYDSESVFDTELIDDPDPQTITVSYTFGGATQTATYTVSVQDYENADNAPYSVTEALHIITAAIGNVESAREIVVTGTVSVENISGNKNRYKISDGVNELLVYAGKGFNNETFTNTNYPKVNDVVKVKGKVINYSNNTPEFVSAKSYLLSQIRPSTLAIEDVASFEVGTADLAVTDLTVTTPSDGDITLVSGDEAKATIIANAIHAVAPGTVTITANLAATENVDALNYAATSTTFSVTVVAPATKYAITFDGNGNTGGSAPEFASEAAAGANITLPANSYTKTGYTFNGWKVYDENEVEVTVTAGAFEMPASPVTIKAQWEEISSWAYVYTSNVTIASNTAAHVTIGGTDYDAAKTSKGATATITLPQGVTTIHLHLVAWKDEAQTVTVSGDCFNEDKELTIIANDGVSGSGTTYALGESGVDYYFSLTPDNEVGANEVITISAAGSKRFVLFGVNQEGGIVPELQSLALSGDLTNKNYEAGAAINPAGLTVMGTYTLGGTPQAPVDVTDQVEDWLYDALQAGDESVTISAKIGTITSNSVEITGLTVTDPTPRFETNPTSSISFGSKEQGATITARDLEVTLVNVSNASVEITGTGAAAFSVDEDALTGNATLHVSASSANVGTFAATLTISDEAGVAADKEISLSLTVTAPVVEETAVSTTSEWVAAEAADLVDGAEVLITGATGGVTYAIGVQNDNNRAAVAGTLSEGVFTPGENTMSFTLVAQEEEGVFALQASNGEYLYAASSSKNYLKRQATLDDNAKWTLTATSAVANGSNTHNDLKFNATNSPKIFSCYTGGQTAIQFYVPKPAPAPKYSVTYAANGGSGDAPAAVEYEEGETFSVAAADLFTAPEGKEFDKWNDGTNDYAPGATYTVGTSDVVLTAYWKDAAPAPVYETVRSGLTAGNYYTICYNKTMTAVQGATLWEFAGKDASFAYIKPAVAPYPAGKPYIVYAESDKLEAVLEGDEVTASAIVANGALHGTFELMNQAALDAAGDNIYLIIGNELRRVDGQTGNTLPAYRAYIDLDQIGSAPANMPAHVRRMPMQKDVATGFENLNASEKPVKLMIDGNIFILRGEKLYDATGRLVK